MDMIVPAFIGLLFIAYFVFLWFAAKTWRWFDLVLLSLAFFLAIGFLPLAAGVMRVRMDWEKVRTEHAVRVERSTQEQEKIKYGDGTGGIALVPLEVEVRQMRADAGRAWRGLRFMSASGSMATAGADAKVILSMPPVNVPADPAAADPAAALPPVVAPAGAADPVAAPPAQSKIDDKAIVYAFAEGDYAGRQTPQFYLGDFKVSEVAGDQITMQPLLPMLPGVVQAISGGSVSTVSLYELMPVDSHQTFIAAGSEPTNELMFGRVDEQLVRELLEGKVSPSTLDAYLRDGSRSLPDDPDDSKWVKVQFIKKHEIVVDSQTKRQADDSGYFDALGQAVDSRLQRNSNVVIEEGSEYYFKLEAAQELDTQGIAKPIDTYFVRPLNDYRFIIFSTVSRLQWLSESMLTLSRDSEVLQAAIDRTVEMQTREQDVKAKLELDLKQTVKEKVAAANYLAKLESELTTVRTRMTSVYEQNILIANQLAVVQAKLTKMIDARAASASR